MAARFNCGLSFRSSALVTMAACLSAAACSAPPGADTGGADVPEFGAFTPPGNTAAVTPAAPSGNGTASVAPPASPPGAGGATGASNEQTGSSGIGLDPAQNGSQNGQNAGAGGSSMAGGAPAPADPGANTGAAGSSFDPGATGSAGSTSMPPSDGQQPEQPAEPAEPQPEQPAEPQPPQAPPPSGDCAGAFFCDGFESVANGESPTAALWDIIDSYGVTDESAGVQVSNANARTGTQALRVTGANTRRGVRATLPQSSYFVRAYFQLDSVPIGPVFIGGGASENDEVRFRIQGQSFATINSVSNIVGDPVRPANANGGGCPECVTLTPNEWLCVELQIDNGAQTATLFIDGVEAAVAGPDAFATQPANPLLFLGSMSVQGGDTSVWIDDIAVGPQRFGCD